LSNFRALLWAIEVLCFLQEGHRDLLKSMCLAAQVQGLYSSCTTDFSYTELVVLIIFFKMTVSLFCILEVSSGPDWIAVFLILFFNLFLNFATIKFIIILSVMLIVTCMMFSRVLLELMFNFYLKTLIRDV